MQLRRWARSLSHTFKGTDEALHGWRPFRRRNCLKDCTNDLHRLTVQLVVRRYLLGNRLKRLPDVPNVGRQGAI